MDTQKRISLMIHDMNPWGGQDRSMLEIAKQLNKAYPLDIHSFSVQGFDDWQDMNHIPYTTPWKRPIILKYFNYHFKSWDKLRKAPNKGPIQSTGTASLKSDVVQVQFIHHRWQEIAKTLPADKSTKGSFFKRSYHQALDFYKKQLEKTVYTSNKKYIAISHSIKKELMDHFQIPEKNISIIYHGVDNNYFKPLDTSPQAQQARQEVRKELGIKDGDTVLLHVGALNARKGIFQSIKTLAYLKKQGFTNLKYLAVGAGDPKIIEALVKEHNLEKEVILAPHTKDIRRYYWASDLFFFPSYYEPFGLVILEAMACGLPVVASDTAGGSELINDQESGILFKASAKPKEIAQVLNPVLKNPAFAKELAKNALTIAQNQSWEKVGQQYIDFYSKTSGWMD